MQGKRQGVVPAAPGFGLVGAGIGALIGRKNGFLFEDAGVDVLRPLPEPEALGAAVSAAMERSQVKPLETSHRATKLTDWPAFKASRARSVKKFEEDFIRIHICGANEANIIYQLEGLPEKDAGLRVLASSNPRPYDHLGERCLAVWRALPGQSDMTALAPPIHKADAV